MWQAPLSCLRCDPTHVGEREHACAQADTDVREPRLYTIRGIRMYTLTVRLYTSYFREKTNVHLNSPVLYLTYTLVHAIMPVVDSLWCTGVH